MDDSTLNINELTRGGRLAFIDLLKGIAIIAIVFYHLGAFKYGFFRVDLFLVINGYLITNSIRNQINRGNFSWFHYLVKRFVRLWPLIIIVCLFSLIIGYFTMLPDDLENLSESVVASDFFGNNILSTITARNYWDVKQDFKPLMHLWYIGVVAQFYVVYIIAIAVVKKVSGLIKSKSFDEIFFGLLVVSTLVGLILFLTCHSNSLKHYSLTYRFWEMTFGGLLVYVGNDTISRFKDQTIVPKNRVIMTLLLLSVILIFIGNKDSLSVTLLVLTVLISGAMVLGADAFMNFNGKLRIPYGLIVTLGMASYSIFIWHQFILAFYRYVITATFGLIDYAIFFAVLAVLSFLSYIFIEKPLKKLSFRKQIMVLTISAVGCVITSGAGLLLYVNAGVVRDVPELDIFKDNVRRGMHASYNGRVYGMNNEFSDDGKIKVLVVGNSLTRDWVNVLIESDIIDTLDISYVTAGSLSKEYAERIKRADYIFSNAFTRIYHFEHDDIIEEFISDDALWYGVGTKEYGACNGNIYNRRNSENYYSQTASYASVADTYELEKRIWTNYIDFIAPVLHENGEISVFTDDNKYISQDTRHLTKAGAQYYARILDLRGIFGL